MRIEVTSGLQTAHRSGILDNKQLFADGMGAESKIIRGVSVTVNPSFDLKPLPLTINQTD